MATSSKKWWLATGAVGAVVAGLMIFCLPTCNRMNKEQKADSEQKDSVAVVNNDDRVRELTDSINELKQDLRDAQELLDDCRESKKTQPRKKLTPRKPVPQKPVRPGKKDTVVVVVEKPVVVTPVPEQNVNVNNCGDGATIVVGNNNNVVVQRPTPAVVADSLNTFKRTTTVTVTVKTKTRQRVYY